MAKSVRSWVKPTEAPGGAEEAHRRWPEGLSEQGASKAKVDPPIHNALPRSRVIWEGHRPAWPKLQPQRGVYERWMRGRVARAKAVQSWVKPEVDPPIHNALPRCCLKL
jgi:hypothetical protein